MRVLIVTCGGAVSGLGLPHPKLAGEREEVRQMPEDQPANRPAPGTAIVADRGFAGDDFEECLAGPELDLTLIRPARKNETNPRCFPNWLRQRVDAVIWTVKRQ